jgi:hypothetical protein
MILRPALRNWIWAVITAAAVSTGSFAASGPRALPALGFYTGGIKPWGIPAAGDFAGSVELSGSRGETLNFMLHVQARGCFEPRLNLNSAVGAKSLPRVETRFYEVLPFVTKHPSYRGAGTGTYWDPVIAKARICSPRSMWLLGEMRIPETASAGRYEGILTVGAEQLPVKLKIWHMLMPEKPSIPLYSELGTWFLLLGHYGKWHDGEAALAAKYIERMLDHRIVPFKHWTRPIPIGPQTAELRTVNGNPSADSFYSTVVAPLPEWARVSLPIDMTLDSATEATSNLITKVSAAVERDGWMNRAYAYLWDEPKVTDLPTVKKYAALVRKIAPGLKILVTMTPSAEFEDLVDIFVPVFDEFEKPGLPPPSAYSELQKKGKEVWAYASCMSHGCFNDTDSGSPDWVIDRPGAHIRSQGWIAQKYGLNALLYYSVDNSYQNFPKGRDPWRDLWDFSGNGDGTLFYPGRPGLHGLTEHGPVDSLRLKLWRQSSFDADYVQMLKDAKKKPEWWPGRLGALVRNVRNWEKSDRPYRELREQIGDYLETLQ